MIYGCICVRELWNYVCKCPEISNYIFEKYTKKGYTSIFVVVVWCAMHDNIIRCFATSCTREISNIKIVINILLKVIGKTIEQNKLLL